MTTIPDSCLQWSFGILSLRFLYDVDNKYPWKKIYNLENFLSRKVWRKANYTTTKKLDHHDSICQLDVPHTICKHLYIWNQPLMFGLSNFSQYHQGYMYFKAYNNKSVVVLQFSELYKYCAPAHLAANEQGPPAKNNWS